MESSTARNQTANTCDAVVVTCIDFRFQAHFDRWLAAEVGYGNYDRVAIAGAVKDWHTVCAQIRVARRLHNVHTVVLVNHEDCGAYGSTCPRERHERDLREARMRLRREIPEVTVHLLFARLDGTLEPVT